MKKLLSLLIAISLILSCCTVFAEDVAEEVAKEVVEEVAVEGTEEVAKEVTEEVAVEGTEEVAKEVTEDVVAEGTKEVTEEVAKEGAEEVTEEVQPAQRIKVACVGDSITFGDGIKKADRPTMTYPAKLQGFLGDEYEVVNFGIVSLCLCETSDKPYTKNAIFQKSIEYNPDIVIIMLGTNDSKTNNWGKYDIVQGMRDFLAHYTSLPSDPEIYIMAPPPAYNDGAWDIQPHIVTQIRDEYIRFTTEENIPFIDIYSVTSNKPELFPDNIHPNIEGAELIAKEVSRALLEEKATYPRGRADTEDASVWAIDYINKAWNLNVAEDSFFDLYTNPVTTEECAVLGEALSKHITGEPADITVESDTRQAFAVMLYDIITASAPDVVTSDAKAMTFDDVDDIDANAKQALAYLYSNGVVRGDDMNMLMPASVITKEEAVTMLVRVYDLLDSSTK